ncbi:MAG: PAS domain-containing hybrid sensor histidine kinase/response regulator [Actinomycetes bacterium]
MTEANVAPPHDSGPDTPALLRHLTDNLRSVVWLVDIRGPRFLYINPAFVRTYGVSQEQLDADPYCWMARVHPDDRAGVEAAVAEVLAAGFVGTEIEYRVVQPDGSVRWLRAQMYRVRDAAGQVGHMVGSADDVTERHRAEQALSESELRFRQIAEYSHYMFWLRETGTGRFLYVNPAYEQIFGGRVQDMYDDPDAWLRVVHPEDRERAAAVPDGPFDEVYRVVPPGRDEVRWVRARSFPVTDEAGRAYRRVGVAEDVTDRRLLQEQLLQSQKMEAVGRLAGGIAHDFNNLLFVILNYVEEALRAVPPGSGTSQDLRRVVEAAERARSLTDQMLTFSRRQDAEPVDLDINESVRLTAGMLSRVLGDDVEVVLALSENLPSVRLDPTQLQQVLLNLAVNARDAMPDGGTLCLTTAPARLPGEPRAPDAPGSGPDARLDPGKGVSLDVSDTGHGMDAEVAARAFEPFYTTKPVGRGTGLGLSSVYGIVEGAGGHVSVASAPGEGTTVTALLPASLRPTRGEEETPGTPASVDGAGRVALVVEDEEMVREALVRQLRWAGFVVHAAANAAEAVGMCQYSLWHVDLLVTDLVMPGMSGYDLVLELGRLGLDPPVVFVSGNTGSWQPAELRGPRRRYLQKPFRAEVLLAAIAEVGVRAPR